MINIYKWKSLSSVEQQKLISRPVAENKKVLQDAVANILETVRTDKDMALFDYTAQFDGVKLDSLKVSEQEIEQAYKKASAEEIELVKKSITRIKNYHQTMKPKTVICDTNDGVVCEKVYKPIQKVGLYVPGGSAPLVSTIIMLAAPAEVAGCNEVYVATPCNKVGEVHPLILIAVDICNVKEVYKLGGAQAIAAMAYGTESVDKVDKIYGPGNSWVTEAKQQVSNDNQGAAIDLPAGPSEVLVVADRNANPSFVAADLLAQAEHGVDSQAILVTDSEILAKEVQQQVISQTASALRKDIIEKSLVHASIIVVDDISKAIDIANEYASEHLILNIIDIDNHLDNIENAGAVFVGSWAAEALGDYITGSNHVLPTYGYAKAYSGLATIDFMKAISIQRVSQQGIENIGNIAMQLAEIEGLDAHKNAVAIRLESLK